MASNWVEPSDDARLHCPEDEILYRHRPVHGLELCALASECRFCGAKILRAHGHSTWWRTIRPERESQQGE